MAPPALTHQDPSLPTASVVATRERVLQVAYVEVGVRRATRSYRLCERIAFRTRRGVRTWPNPRHPVADRIWPWRRRTATTSVATCIRGRRRRGRAACRTAGGVLAH